MEQNTQALVDQVALLSPERQQVLRYLLEVRSVAEVAAALFVEMERLCLDLALEEAGYGLFAPARRLPMAPPPHACQCRQGAVRWPGCSRP